MPLSIDRSLTADVSTLFDTEFIRSLTQYLGMDPDTPSEDMPLSVNELLEEAISSCEQEQWRLILPCPVSIILPVEAFYYPDGFLFLPLGEASDLELTYLDTEEVEQPFTDFIQYAGEPIRLWSNCWDTLTSACIDTPYPITATYTPGYASYDKIPKSTIRALKILVCHNFEFRAVDSCIPEAYKHNMNLGWLNNERANKYIIDDWNKVAPR